MGRVSFVQKKPIVAIILGTSLLLLFIYNAWSGAGSLGQLIGLGTLSVLLLGYSVVYEVDSHRDFYIAYCFFKVPVFRKKLNIFYPEYVSVFPMRSGKNSDWGPVSAMGKRSNSDEFCVRIFNDKEKFTLIRTSNSKLALRKAKALSELLKVELVNKI